MDNNLLIENGTIITPHVIIKRGSVLISGGKITDVIRGTVPNMKGKAKVLNAGGNMVIPGFIDVHVQGAGGADTLDGTEKALRTIAKTLAKNGTTSFLATTVVTDRKSAHLGVVGKAIKNGTGGANLLGIHLEGPYINPLRKGMIKKENIRTKISAKELKQIIKLCRNKLSMMTLAPELSGALEAISFLKKNGIVVSFGHSNATYEQTRQGLKAGINHVTHIFNAMPQLHHRSPGPLAAIFENKNCFVQLISDGVHIHQSVVRLLLKAVGIKRIVLITDAMSAAGLPDGSYLYNGLRYRSHRGAARYHDGTLIGTALMLRDIAKRMIEMTGITVSEAIEAASLNPAKALGIDRAKGSIERGKDADIAVIDRNFNVKNTIIGGRVIF